MKDWDYLAFSSSIDNVIVATRYGGLSPPIFKKKLYALFAELPDQWRSRAKHLVKHWENPPLKTIMDAIAADLTHTLDAVQHNCYRMLRTAAISLFAFEGVSGKNSLSK